MKPIYTALIFILMSSSCDTVDRLVGPKAAAEENMTISERLNAATPVRWEVTKDYLYDTLSPFQNYDIHRPIFESDSTVPALVVISIHGGGWSLLDKGYLDPILYEFRDLKKNLIIFNMNHRLAFEEGVGVDEMLDDIESMLKEIKSKKEELNLSDDIVLHGHSSGGHLALLYAKDRVRKKKIVAVSAVAPPTDLTDPKVLNLQDGQNRNLTEMLLNTTYQKSPKEFKEASPYHSTTRSSRPTILFIGENDEIIGVEQGEKMAGKLEEKNVPHEFYKYPNTGHGMENRWKDIPAKVVDFLQKR